MFFSFMIINDSTQRTKLEEIYTKYRKIMFYVAKGILNNDFLAEDAVHKTFEKLFNYLHKIEDVSSSKTKGFLIIMVRNVSIDMYHEDQKDKHICLDETIELEDTHQPSMPELIISKENYLKIINTVKELPIIYRDTFLLKYTHYYENKEIAELLQIEEANVRKRLQVARMMLRKTLNNEVNDSEST